MSRDSSVFCSTENGVFYSTNIGNKLKDTFGDQVHTNMFLKFQFQTFESH